MAFQGASSSSSTSRWTHDLFLSFRGEDTRHNFTAHLHKALLQKGIITFIDDEIRRGEEISPALVEAIQKSRISIIIFSQTYASSRWCLDEVLEILECKKTKRQMVLPVFYKVDPSDVRYQKNSFKKAFAKHEERFKDDLKVQQWKAALKQVADLAGYAFVSGNEAKFIDKIVQNVSRIMNHTYLHVANYPVGIESRVREINSLLSIHEMNDIRMVGILGAGGIGKTTIAKDIYNSIYSQFDGCCFLETIREASKKHFGMVKLQSTLLSKILGHTVRVDSVGEGIIMIKKRLDSKKVLLILDDIDDKLLQLDKLAGGLDWFGSGSRIIITTRDRKVLTDHEVVDDLIYKVKELDRNEALELFRWNAFKGAQPTDDSLKLMEHAISYAGGLPLALEVLGSYLYRKDIHEWKDALNKYKCSPHKSIQKILRTSYDGLHDTEKNIFLDIACFFKGKPADEVIKILDSCKFFPKDGIKVLIEKSLITIFGLNTLQMHDLLQDMGREIVREESPEDPSKRSRLWFHEDVRQVLEEDTGTNNIQGILVDLPEGEDMVHLSSKAFKNMRILRLLMVYPNARFSGRFNFLSNELRVFDWPNCPLEYFPSNFRGAKLGYLRMPKSHIKGLKGVEKFQSMKIMDFSGCQFLKIIPDVSTIPNLEDLILDGCTNLVESHDSIGSLDKLASLSLKNCYNLRSFPTSLKLRSLEYLNLENCSMINHFPEIECQMEFLECIYFGGTGIKKLPSSIRYLIGLEHLNLEGCRNLINLPSSIYELQHLVTLFLSDCSKLVKFPKKMGYSGQSMLPLTNSSVSNDGCSSIVFPALRELSLENCVLLESDFFRIFNCSSTLKKLNLSGSGIVTIPACIKRFVALEELNLDNCKQLREIQAFPPNSYSVDAKGCMSLDLYNKCLLLELPAPCPMGSCIEPEEHREHSCFDIVVSGNKIPDWFNYRKEVSNSNSCEIDIDVPADLDGEITRIAFSAVVDKMYSSVPVIWFYVISGGVEIYSDIKAFFHFSSDCVWLHFHVLESFKRKEYNGHLRVKFVCEGSFTAMKSCGFHMARMCEEKTRDSIDGIQVTKRPRDYGNLESNWYPQQKRHSSSSGVRISYAEAEAEEF